MLVVVDLGRREELLLEAKNLVCWLLKHPLNILPFQSLPSLSKLPILLTSVLSLPKTFSRSALFSSSSPYS